MDVQRKNAIRSAIAARGITTRFGEVEKLEPIGEGGNGLVYGGVLLNHAVAIKLLADSSRDKLARFKAEYLHLRALPAHRGVVRLIHYEEIDTSAGVVPAIVMARYDGSLRGRQAVTTRDLQSFLTFLLTTLEFLHGHGVVHRDLKPENILVDAAGFAITDFGIASYNPEVFGQQEFRTRKGDILGNRGFSAPEQTTGAAAHPTMDIYAVGQLCQWYALGSTHHGTQRRSIASRFPEADALDIVVNRCLSHDPRLRYQEIGELRRALEEQSSQRRLQDAWECLHRFSEVLSETFPRTSRGIASTTDPKVIERFFTGLQRRNKPTIAFWFDGRGTNHVDDLAPLGDGLWLVDGMEISPARLWVNRHPGEHGDFALLLLNPRPSFGLYESAGSYEEAALVGNTYITRSEYDNGFAEIDGEVVSLAGRNASVRVRHTIPRAILIASKYHDAARPENDRLTTQIVRAAVAGTLGDEDVEVYADAVVEHIHPELIPGL